MNRPRAAAFLGSKTATNPAKKPTNRTSRSTRPLVADYSAWSAVKSVLKPLILLNRFIVAGVLYVMQKMPWIRKHWTLIAIYITFAVCAAFYGSKKHLYADVESWPSVPAKNVDTEMYEGESRGDRRYYGTTSSSFRSESVSFSYFVDGINYEGDLATADGGGLPRKYDYEVIPEEERNGEVPLRKIQKPWLAYYHPDSPSTAVLDNQPYEGIGLLVTMVITGIIILVHIATEIIGHNKSQHPTVSS